MESVVETAVVQVDDDGQFPNAALCAAFLGFRHRGREVLTRTPDQIEEIDARPETLVFGGVEVVRGYLARLGVDPPHLDYPERLRQYMGRDVEVDTLGVVRRRYREPGEPVFVKPVEHKAFPGRLVRRFGDLLPTSHLDAATLVYVVEHVEFLSEWRFYCEKSQIVGCGHYRGHPLHFPKESVVRESAVEFSRYSDGPVTYALDFGVSEDGRTLLVEVNDMFALGSYGLDPRIYSYLVERRWDQLVEGRTTRDNGSGQDHPPTGA